MKENYVPVNFKNEITPYLKGLFLKTGEINFSEEENAKCMKEIVRLSRMENSRKIGILKCLLNELEKEEAWAEPANHVTRLLEKVDVYINEHIGEKIMVSDIAGLIYMSPNSVSRFF